MSMGRRGEGEVVGRKGIGEAREERILYYKEVCREERERERVREAALKRGCQRTLNVTAVHGMGIQHAVQLQHLTVVGGFS